MKYHLVILGCQMNKSDGERVNTVLDKYGFQYVDSEEEAELLGVIACSVRQKAIDKVYSKIHKWNKWKNKKNLITFISGCVLPADKEKFLKLFDIIFPMSELNQLPEMIAQYGIVSPLSTRLNTLGDKEEVKIGNIKFDPATIVLDGERDSSKNTGSYMREFWHVQPKYNSPYEAFIPIQNGCDKFCTYCAVPYTRGREVSRPSEEILEELKTAVEKGYKSITLLGQNVNSYGLDKHGKEIDFAELLRRVGEYGNKCGKEFWLYFTSPHPRDMTDEVIDVIAEYDCLAKQIHIPIQSGDDKVLIKMNRKHNLEDYRHIIHKIWNTIPQATIFTDIIVGFTGETDEQFENTRKAMEEFKYNMAYIAVYSPRPGAASSRWEDDVPHAIKKERLHTLTNELTKHTLVYNQKMIGKTYRVLVTGEDRKSGFLSGLTEGKLIVRFKSAETINVGDFINVKITSVTDFATEGEMVGTEKLETVG